MAKPLNYGPTIGVRLPLDLHDQAIEAAGQDGPGPWIRSLVEAALRGEQLVLNKPREHGHPKLDENVKTALGIIAGCDHHRIRATNGGMFHCDDCDTTHRSKKDFQ